MQPGLSRLEPVLSARHLIFLPQSCQPADDPGRTHTPAAGAHETDRGPLSLEASAPLLDPVQATRASENVPPNSMSQTASNVKADDFSHLHHVFYDLIATAMLILSEHSLFRDLRTSPESALVKSISHAVALLAISVSKPHRYLEKPLYMPA